MTDEIKKPEPTSSDQAVKAEEVKYRIKLIKWNYYLEVAKNIGGILKVFRDEAISLVAGTSTLVTGFFEIKKIFRANSYHHMGNQQFDMKATAMPSPLPSSGLSGLSGSGGGSGERLASIGITHKARKHSKKSMKKESAVSSESVMLSSPMAPSSMSIQVMPEVEEHWSFDSNTGIGSVSFLILIFFSLRVWFKKRRDKSNTPTKG
jgi:hypothetical protein